MKRYLTSDFECSASDCQYDICYSESEAIRCDAGGFVDLLGRQCTATCDTTAKNKVQTVTTMTNECTTCLDRYCEKCPEKSYVCETYKIGKEVNPKYMFFNYTDKSLTVRFEKMVNFSRLNEYLNVSYPGYKIPD